jgi:hypothetical protein
MKIPIESCYKIIYDDTDSKKWCVELLSPCNPFHEIIYSYGKFSLIAKDENDPNPKFNYEIDIIYVPERLREVNMPDEKKEEMETLIASILLDILGKNADKAKSLDGKLYLELSRDTNG